MKFAYQYNIEVGVSTNAYPIIIIFLKVIFFLSILRK